jgi:hypothetical protein
MVWEGKNAVVTGRKMLGATNPAEEISLLRQVCVAFLRRLKSMNEDEEENNFI